MAVDNKAVDLRSVNIKYVMINAYSVTNTPGYIGLANFKGNIYRGNMRMPAEGLIGPTIQYNTIQYNTIQY